jgi:uncharacterized protein (DUF3820 family)
MKYQYQHIKMPYGKYKGVYLKDVPDDYIKWGILNYTDRGMAEMMSTELQRRYPKMRK